WTAASVMTVDSLMTEIWIMLAPTLLANVSPQHRPGRRAAHPHLIPAIEPGRVFQGLARQFRAPARPGRGTSGSDGRQPRWSRFPSASGGSARTSPYLRGHR